MGHTLLLCGIGLDINNVAYAVFDKEGRQLDGAVICAMRSSVSLRLHTAGGDRTLEATLEHVARTRAVTE